MSSTMRGKTIKRANTSTIQDKFMVGYQGWFTCPGDGPPIYEGHHGWLHWLSEPIPNGGRINTDLWPDFSEYSPSELYPVPGLKYPSGEQAFVFSSRNPKTVQRHFHWMATHGVDGAFLQRFLGQCDVTAGNEGIRNERDEIGDYVRDAAEKEGRAFAIMYDVSGVAPDRMQAVFEQDWVHLIREKAVLDSPNYLREKGKPVVVIWGFGFADRNHTPESVRAITNFIRNVTPGGVYLMAGVPAHWRTSTSDADPNPEFLDIWLNEFDALSPWTIGRYGNEEDADRFAEEKIKGDIELIQRRNEEGGHKHIDYIPVVLPGGSGYNTSQGQWGFNDIKRNGGRFLWKQIYNARRLGVRTIYGAMWDEYDEGTAYLPVVSHKSSLPILDNVRFMALDEDGHDLPPDWYMRITGYAAEVLRGERMIHETFPVKELKDFWSSRPKYEEENHHMAGVSGSASGFGGGQGQSYQEWLSAQRDDRDELPPPPYSLEVGAPEVPAATRPAESSPRPPVVDTSSRPPVATGAHIQVPAPPSPPPVPSRSSSATVSSITQDFSKHYISQPSVATSSASGSQSQWPPPEWNVPSSSSSLTPQVIRQSSVGSPGGSPGYRPTYAPPSPIPPKPQQSSSFSGSQSHAQRPQHNFPTEPPPQQQPQWVQSGSYPSQDSHFGGAQQQPLPYQPYRGLSHPPHSNQYVHNQYSHSPPPIPPRPEGSLSPPPGGQGSYRPRPPPPASASAPFVAGHSAGPPSLLGSGPLGFALNAVDRVTGQDTRKRVEALAESGSKLFNKFTK